MEFNNGPSLYHSRVDSWPSAPLGVEEPPLPRQDWEAGDNSDKLSVKDIGMSVPFGIAAGNVQGVEAKIRSGAGHLELQFPGAGGGNRQSQVPGMYGKEQRQALREMSKVNDVAFTTHASFSVMGVTGADQQGNMNLSQGKQSYDEIVRAIDFAKDVADGGSVTVHVGEFERPLTHIYPDGVMMDDKGDLTRNYSREPKTGRLQFQKHPFEAQKAQFGLVDDRTGQTFTTVQLDRTVAQPIWRKADKDYTDMMGRTVKTGDYIDYEENLIDDPYAIKFEMGDEDKFDGARVPEINEQTGRFETEMKSLEDFEREAKEYNDYFRRVQGRDPTPYERMTGKEMYMKSTLWTRAGYAYGWALNFSSDVPELKTKLSKLHELREYYKELDENIPQDEKWKIVRQSAKYRTHWHDLVPPESKNPMELIDQDIDETRKRLEYAWQSGNTQELEAIDQFETMRHLKTPEKYFEKYGTDFYAMAGIKAADASQKTKKPVTVTLEHIFPERFGGHPQELKWIINKARDRMVEMMTSPKIDGHVSEGQWFKQEGQENREYGPFLQGQNPYFRQGMSREEARKLAEQSIKATIDTGHLNMWRKYYVDDPNKSVDENEKQFNSWMVGQMEDLAKDGLIGNVHLSDNFGFHDTHLAPGQGNAPVREIVKAIKKHGYNERIIVEPGADATTGNSDFHGLMKTWEHFGATNYMGHFPGVGAPPPQFADVHYGYFGRSYPPNFVFGAYAPSNDWTLWSGVQME
ncbi:MAG: TIM barrel protein [archaeon]